MFGAKSRVSRIWELFEIAPSRRCVACDSAIIERFAIESGNATVRLAELAPSQRGR
jgi:hypothetical protein